MINSIMVTNYAGEVVELSLTDPWETGLIITSITGLGPPRATINDTDIATGDGSIFNSSRVNKRNIVFNFQLTEVIKDNKVVKTIEQVRLDTYSYFALKKPVKLLFETDTRSAEIFGYVESNEPNIFSPNEATVVSIICEDPFFKTHKPKLSMNGAQGLFEFPFSNESLDEKLINLGEIYESVSGDIVYSGDTDTGVVIHIEAIGPAKNIRILNTGTKEIFTLDTSKIKSIVKGNDDDIIERDAITISSVVADIYITLVRNGKHYNILQCVSRTCDWLHLARGKNTFNYSCESGAENLRISIDNYVLYGGI